MALTTRAHTVHIIEGNPVTSESMGYLLAARSFEVKFFKNNQSFIDDGDYAEGDTIILELAQTDPETFRLLNRLIYSPLSPNTIIILEKDSILKPGDLFPADNVTVLFHPLNPHDLVAAISAFR